MRAESEEMNLSPPFSPSTIGIFGYLYSDGKLVINILHRNFCADMGQVLDKRRSLFSGGRF